MDLFKVSQNEISETSEVDICRRAPSSVYSNPVLSSPSASSQLLVSNDSQCPLIESSPPQRPDPVLSAESSRTPSCYGTTACTTPNRWSFVEKDKDNIDVLEVSFPGYSTYTMLNCKIPARSVSSSSCATTFEVKYSDGTYVIEKLHDYDDYELMPNWKRWLSRLSPLTTLLAVGSYYLYFPYRIYCTRASSVKWHKTYVLAWFFIVAEALVARKGSMSMCNTQC